MMQVQLAGGAAMPAAGLGMWKVDGAAVPGLIEQAVAAGWRHFDCACDYGNETEVGAGLSRVIGSQCSREDLWITSKLWNTYHRPEHVRLAAERSLSDLGLDYLDLYLIHFPIAQAFVPLETRYPPGWFFDPDAEHPHMKLDRVPILETWQAMERLVDDGLVRHIGVCNFGVSLLRDLLNSARVPLSVLQVESHPLLVQAKLLRFCLENGIGFTAFSPLGALSYLSLGMAGPDESLLAHPVVTAIADSVTRTPAQVLLRWGVQRGGAVVPKTSNPERLRENLALFDFELSAEQMAALDGLDQNRRFNDPGVFCEQAFNTFCPIYE
ncbi:MAG: aldo/keto reductase [Planctomycetales bacterium]|nr:aldo/keto reductase [Planctomycetales bacterium]